MSDFIGKTIQFACEPYHSGEMTIESATPLKESPCTGPNAYTIKGHAKYTTTSRLFQHTSVREEEGEFIIYRAYAHDIEKGFVRYIYPV